MTPLAAARSSARADEGRFEQTPGVRQLAILSHLARVLYGALFWSPLDNVRGIVGRLRDLGRPSSHWSELNMLHIRSRAGIARLLSFLFDVFLLPFGLRRRLNRFLGQVLGDDERPAPLHVDGLAGYENEAWFYLNGIATNEGMARESGEYLAQVFRRPIEVLPNFTRSLLPDLIQVTAQKGFLALTSAGRRAFAAIAAALRDPTCDRVIVLAHSQGAVIIGRVLLALDEATRIPAEALRKLEVYTFGNPVDTMVTRRPIGHIEHFANQKDLVARLGVLAAPAVSRGAIRFDGALLVCDRYGHFFNEHYLHGIELRAFVDVDGQPSGRLYEYLNGAVPLA